MTNDPTHDAHSKPPAPRAPAPWVLRGEATALLYRFSEEWVRDQVQLPTGFTRALGGGLGVVMLVRYFASPVGPYDELLVIPGRFQSGGAAGFTIGDIWVSSEASVDNGRRNWAIPKKLARFEVTNDGRRQRFCVEVGGARLATFETEAGRWGLPLTTALVPKPLRTLLQSGADRGLFQTTIGATATLRRARLLRAETHEGMPAINAGSLLGAWRLTGLQMTFPAATVIARP